MTWVNVADVEAQLRGAGLLLASVKNTRGGAPAGALYVDSVKTIRCDVEGEQKKQTGAYQLHTVRIRDELYIAGVYWVDHGNASYKIDINKECAACGADFPLKVKACPVCGHGKSKAKPIDEAALAAHRKAQAEAQRQAAADAERHADLAAAWADIVWLHACIEPDADHTHDYIARKHLNGYHGARILGALDGTHLPEAEGYDYELLGKLRGALVLPMVNHRGQRRGLQMILSRELHAERIRSRETDKEFWPRRIINDGLYTLIGGEIHDIGIVAEGFATGATLHEESNLPVAVAYQANRIGPVGEGIWKKSRRRARLMYAADDDWLQSCKECKKFTPVDTAKCCHCGEPHGKGNAGVKACSEAAQSTRGVWVKPTFAVERSRERKGDSDFNDLRVREGVGAVRIQISAKLADAGWVLTPSAAAALCNQGDGEGDGGKGRRGAMSVMPLDDIVARFMPLDDGTGKYVFDTWTNKIALREQMITLLPAGVRGDDIKRHPVYVERGAYYLDQVGFDPSGNDRDVKLNTWQGWPMEPKAGECSRLLELLAYLCSGDANSEALYRWVLRWMAYPLQHPGAKMSSAIIMHGPQGTGKSTVWQCLAKIYGDYATVLNQRGLEDRFNSDWVDSKLFILAEEVVTRAEMWHIKNELKELISGEWIRVNPKNVAAYRQRNQVNGVFLSNENQPLPLDNDDRRHCVIYTPPAVGEEYYDEVYLEIERGGVAALYHYLMTLDLGDFHPKKKPPMTEAKQALIALSTPSEMRFALEWVAGELGLPVCPAISTDVYAAYLRWCRTHGESRPRPDNQFHGALSRMVGWEKKKARIYPDLNFMPKTAMERTVVFPPTHATGVDYAFKEGTAIPVWVTECVIAFADALNGGENSRSAYG
jgi:putative DNA primase/helicase